MKSLFLFLSFVCLSVFNNREANAHLPPYGTVKNIPYFRIDANHRTVYTFDIFCSVNTSLQVDWGDSHIDTFTNDNYYSPVHQYASDAQYKIVVSDLLGNSSPDIVGFAFQNCPINSVHNLDSFVNVNYFEVLVGQLGLVPFNMPNALTTFDFRFNAIDDISFFDFPTSLSTMLLSNNAITSLDNVDLSASPSIKEIEIAGNFLSSIGNFTVPTTVDRLMLNGNSLSSSDVSTLLIDLAANGLHNGTVNTTLQSPPAPLTAAGIVAKDSLVARGWSVATD